MAVLLDLPPRRAVWPASEDLLTSGARVAMVVLLVMFLGVLLITYVPALTTALRRYFSRVSTPLSP